MALIGLSVFGGGWVDQQAACDAMFDYPGTTLAGFVIAYGWLAAIVPVWLLLAPRDYLSTFLKLGTVFLLAIAILLMHPQIKMPAITQFVDGTGPLFTGKVFPFVFITIACGAVSGFHALISSGTTPKLIANERDVRLIGYGAGMALESLSPSWPQSPLRCSIRACISPSTSVPALPGRHRISPPRPSPVGASPSAAQMAKLAHDMGEATLFARTGGAPSLAVGMATIFGSTFGRGLLSVWYRCHHVRGGVHSHHHRCRHASQAFMLQDLLGHVAAPLGRTSWYPSVLISSSLIVAGWGYFLYIGVIDPNGGINILWPLFSISNQMLAGIALAVAMGIIIKNSKPIYALVTGGPLAWLALITTVAAWEKVVSADPKLGFFAAATDMANKLAAGALPAAAAVAPPSGFSINAWTDG